VDRRAFIAASGALLITRPNSAIAQRKVPVIGLLWNDSVKPSPFVATLVTALGEKGYAVGRDIRIEDRVSLEGYGGYGESIAQLMRAKVDVIVAYGTTGIQAAAKATKEIPIVMITGSDPVALGLVASLSRPGGNVTGVSVLTVGLTGKRMELLKELAPDVSQIGVLLAPNVANPATVREVRAAAQALKVEIHFAEVRAADEIEARVGELVQAGAGAIHVSAASLLAAHSARVVNAIAKHRVPAAYGVERYTDAGGLMTYSVGIRRAFARAAGYVDSILKGARPGDLAIEQLRDFGLVLNLKTARSLGIKIPQSVLVRADRVIE